MEEGLNLRFTGDFIADNFEMDSYGSLFPKTNNSYLDAAEAQVRKQLEAKTGLFQRVTSIYRRADVQTAYRPLGSSPVISFGYKRFGPTPRMEGHNDKAGNPIASTDYLARCERRERRFESYQSDVNSLTKALMLKADSDARSKLLMSAEWEQVLTGGGYDNTAAGDVTKSGMLFLSKGYHQAKFKDTAISKLQVEAAIAFKEYEIAQGMKLGSLAPEGGHLVRYTQESDGMMGWPVCAKSNSALTVQVATRLLLVYGVDTRQFVNTDVTDEYSEVHYKYRVIDACCYILDHMVAGSSDLLSIIILLVRTQRHGYKLEDGHIKAKPGKTRSVYPNSAIPGLVEAMTFAAVIHMWQKLKISFMPGLQPKSVRNDMIFKFVTENAATGYDGLSVDYSKFDATVIGGRLATFIYYGIRPFFNAKYYPWVDAATWILVNKYVLVNRHYADINNDLQSDIRAFKDYRDIDDTWTIYHTVDGMISGAKFTNGGDSLYGECSGHYMLPKLVGSKPKFGPQGGDDAYIAIEKRFINYASSAKTFETFTKPMQELGLDFNADKQFWHVGTNGKDSELLGVFLQEYYNSMFDIRGVGSSARYTAALPYSEHGIYVKQRGKKSGMTKSSSMATIVLQECAVITKENNGADSPFVKDYVRFWLEQDQALGALFKENGANSWNVLTSAAGMPLEEVAKAAGVNEFNWGTNMDDFKAGNLPILKTMIEVAAGMSFPETAAEAFSKMNVTSGDGDTDEQEPDTLDEPTSLA